MTFRDEIKSELVKHIIPFWKGLRDDTYGGYYGMVDYYLNVDKTAPKSCILNSRILWFFSSVCVELKDRSLLPYATHAYEFLMEHCLDTKHGGVYWMLGHDGSPVNMDKHIYAQAFALYALSAYYLASQDEEALKQAQCLYDLIEEKAADEFGYLEAFNSEFVLSSNEELSENGVMAARTMNTLLHVLEAYAGLYEANPTPKLEDSMRRILNIFQTRVYNPKQRRLDVFFDENMNSILDIQSYGHDIEASWLLDWAAGLLGDAKLMGEISNLCSNLVDSAYLNSFKGSCVWNERINGQDDKTRVWWVQAEAMVGFINEAHKHAHEDRYLLASRNIWNYIKSYLIDKRPGSEWFWKLNEAEKPFDEKPIVEPWKCPYHNGRMCLEILRRTGGKMA